MAEDIPYDKNLDLIPGRVDEPMPGVRRILCNNPGPFTFKGTVSYIVGRGRVAIIDPGPDGEVVQGEGWTIEAVTTPGHTANHMAFAYKEANVLFSGDHVMAWSTPVVAPPDGSMGDYMASLQKLAKRGEPVYFPGHGPSVRNAQRFVAAYILHRKAREASIVNRLSSGETDIATLVAAIYSNLDPRLTKAAGMSVLAHLEELVARGVVQTNGPASIAGRYRLVG